MIFLVSQVDRERAALAMLCAPLQRPIVECDSVRKTARSLRRCRPHVVIARHKLGDGFSDDVIALLDELRLAPSPKIIVLVTAGTNSNADARQLELGADCVLRDPVRSDVLLAYISKYCRSPRQVAQKKEAAESIIRFAGGVFRPSDRLLHNREHVVSLTSREAELLELLTRSRGEIVTYESLYSEILGRSFRGETSNMRVLLGKLGGSTSRVGIALRQWVEVIPKMGYRYRGVRLDLNRHPPRTRSPFLPAA